MATNLQSNSGLDFVILKNKKLVMSILEMKAIAFEKLAALQSEADLQEILAHLARLNNGENEKSPFMQHAEAIIKERNSVLEKLAQ